MAPSLSTLRSDESVNQKSNKTGTMKVPEASPAEGTPPATTPSPALANEANGLTPSPPALTNDANGATPSPGGPVGPPATPTTTTVLVHRRRRLATPSPSTTTDCSPYLANLYRTGSIFGIERSAEPCEFRRSPKKRIRTDPPDVEQWLTTSQLEEDEAALFAELPPIDPPMSPTPAAPFMPQSQRLKRSYDKTFAHCNGDADSEFSDDSDDARAGSDMDYEDLDGVPDFEPLGPPITENEEYYLNRDAIEPTNRSVKVLSTEEITKLCGQPQDLADILYQEIRRLIWAARGRPRMLRKIYKLLSDSIAVIEMTKKVSHRLCFLERILEEHLPELDDDEVNSALMNNLEVRICSLEGLHEPGNGDSQQNGESPRSQETVESSGSYQTGESSRSYQTGESSRSQQIGESSQQIEQAVIAHEQVQVYLEQIEEEDEEDEESDEEVEDENLDPEARAERARERIRRGKAPVRPNGLL